MALICSPALAREKIRRGLSSVSARHGAAWVAEQKRFFRKEGPQAQIIVTGGGGLAKGFTNSKHC